MSAAATAPAALVEHVSKEYLSLPRLIFGRRAGRPPSVALRDVSFSVARGETLGLLGPNGAGKTTLLKILATLIAPTTGTVRLDGVDVAARPRAARQRVGLVTCDERSFYWRLTGMQNLHFFASLYGLSRREADERIGPLLETLGLTAAAGRPYQGYSSGMKQKLAIARGLLARPRVVLYDEPTRSLDPVSAHNIRAWIVEARGRTPWQTHILATNQLSEAEQLCDRVLIVNRGTILAQGTIEDLRRQWRDSDSEIHHIRYRRGSPLLHLAPDSAAGLLEPPEHEPIERDGAADEHVLRVRARRGSPALSMVLGQLLAQGGTILRCETTDLTLDDIFRAVVREAPEERRMECAV